MANVIEEAKSGRASCRTCKETIAKGALRLGVEVQTQFSDTPSMQWHHLPCAASKLPGELKSGLAAYAGDVANRDELERAMTDAIQSGKVKPTGYPYVDKAPTGRAKCIQCSNPIDKGTLRVAVEREVDTGAFMNRSAGYLHPACAVANLEGVGGSVDDLVAGIRKNSLLAEADLESALAEITG